MKSMGLISTTWWGWGERPYLFPLLQHSIKCSLTDSTTCIEKTFVLKSKLLPYGSEVTQPSFGGFYFLLHLRYLLHLRWALRYELFTCSRMISKDLLCSYVPTPLVHIEAKRSLYISHRIRFSNLFTGGYIRLAKNQEFAWYPQRETQPFPGWN